MTKDIATYEEWLEVYREDFIEEAGFWDYDEKSARKDYNRGLNAQKAGRRDAKFCTTGEW